VEAWDLQPRTREGWLGLDRMAERLVVPVKSGNADGGKGPQFKDNAGSGESREIGLSLTPPEKVRKLQEALHAKAKGSPSYRFYSLYDKVCREEVLAYAYECSKANRGAVGVDQQDFEGIERYGKERWLGELAEELKAKKYEPQPVRRVYIPKPNGKQRPLGIPTIKDRVVQTAVLVVVGPIFEADLPEEQYAYRSERSALEAIRRVHQHLIEGHTGVVDADLSGYFDNIPHAELMKCLARRISDGEVLRLVKLWLEAPVEEKDERGQTQRTTRNKDEGRGTPQGAPISPLLANLYMRRFVRAWKKFGHEERLDAHIVNYADDFVILCRGTEKEAEAVMRGIMKKLKLEVNEEKTRVRRVPEESVVFLGYEIGRCYSPKTGRAYIGTRPSKKAIRKVCEVVRERTNPRWEWRDARDLVGELNRMLRGWANYFCLGSVSRAYRAVDAYVGARLRRWLCGKHKVTSRGYAHFPASYLSGELGLLRLPLLTATFPWAKA